MRTHLITTVFILLLALSASGAEYATDKSAVKLSGQCSLASASGELYEIDGGAVTHILFSIRAAGFERRGFALGLTLEYLNKYDRYQSDNQTLFTIGPDVTVYPFRRSDNSHLAGSILPYISLGVLGTQFQGRDHAVVSGRLTLGGDCMLSESVALDIGLRAERLWRPGMTGGYAVNLLAGLAYHVF